MLQSALVEISGAKFALMEKGGWKCSNRWVFC